MIWYVMELNHLGIRNHVPEIMYKAFEIAGYSRESMKIHGMINTKAGNPAAALHQVFIE